MTDFRKNVYKFIVKHRLIGPGERLLVGVSGGVDSVVLLEVLRFFGAGLDWELAVAHYNHGLRGQESDADEEFVRKLAAGLGIEFFTERGPVSETANADGVSIEMAAREMRHGFLVRSAERAGARKIVLAHHIDDQIELFFLRAFRGSGARGLGGMAPIAPSAFDERLFIVRPLLGIAKDEISSFAKAEKLEFREDRSNLESNVPRNRIRNKLLPFMRERFGSGFETTIPRVMETIASEHDYVREAAARWLSRKEVPFGGLHPAVARQVLVLQLREYQIEPEFALIGRLLAGPGKPVFAAGGISVIAGDNGKLEIVPDKERLATNLNESLVVLDSDSGQFAFDDVTVRWARTGEKPARPAGPGTEWLDADKVGSAVRLRYWRDGDRMQPIGMECPVKLQDIFVNSRIPRSERRQRVLAETERGEIFWVEGLRISEQVKLDDQTNTCLNWIWERKAGTVPGGNA